MTRNTMPNYVINFADGQEVMLEWTNDYLRAEPKRSWTTEELMQVGAFLATVGYGLNTDQAQEIVQLILDYNIDNKVDDFVNEEERVRFKKAQQIDYIDLHYAVMEGEIELYHHLVALRDEHRELYPSEGVQLEMMLGDLE